MTALSCIMAETAEDHQDFNTDKLQDKVESTTSVSDITTPSKQETPTKRNAFAELMSPRPLKQNKSTTTDSTTTPDITKISKPNFYARNKDRNTNDPRSGLLSYILHPETYPSHVVLRTTEHTVLIRDLYPKATIHLLLLPRSPKHRNLHPHDAFSDLNFLSTIKSEAITATQLATSELHRLISPHSFQCQSLNLALSSPSPPSTLPPSRNFHPDIKIGIHTHPSMSHLHIHIISRDMHSSNLKHKKHYNSFNTPFFIPLDDYPLPEDDIRRDTTYQNGNLKGDFTCWRCGRGFGNRFKELKAHLEGEFEEWRAE